MSAAVDILCDRIGGVLGDSDEAADLLDKIRPILGEMETHGDGQLMAAVSQQVEAFALAIDAGDVGAATQLLAQYGNLAAAFGIDPAKLVQADRRDHNKPTREHRKLEAALTAVVTAPAIG